MTTQAAQCPEIHKLSCIFPYSHCIFWHHLSSVFRSRICIPIKFCRKDIREDANNHKMVSCTDLWCNLCTVVDQASQMDFGLWDSFFSKYFRHPFLSVVQREERTWVSILHAYFRRAGNCNYLFSNTVLLLSIDSILLVLFQHLLTPAILNQSPCVNPLFSGVKVS